MGLLISMSDSTGETHIGLYICGILGLFVLILLISGARDKFTMPDPDHHDVKHNVPYENVLNIPQAHHMYCQCPAQC